MVETQEKNELDSLICWVTHEQASCYLGVHITQYRKDASFLHELGLIDREKNSKGCTRTTLETLREFRLLALERGRKSAAIELLRRRNQNGN